MKNIIYIVFIGLLFTACNVCNKHQDEFVKIDKGEYGLHLIDSQYEILEKGKYKSSELGKIILLNEVDRLEFECKIVTKRSPGQNI